MPQHDYQSLARCFLAYSYAAATVDSCERVAFTLPSSKWCVNTKQIACGQKLFRLLRKANLTVNAIPDSVMTFSTKVFRWTLG
jgi:hypothetical protein